MKQCIIIIGLPGAGKTELAKGIQSYIQRMPKFIISDVIQRLVNPGKKCIVIDDPKTAEAAISSIQTEKPDTAIISDPRLIKPEALTKFIKEIKEVEPKTEIFLIAFNPDLQKSLANCHIRGRDGGHNVQPSTVEKFYKEYNLREIRQSLKEAGIAYRFADQNTYTLEYEQTSDTALALSGATEREVALQPLTALSYDFQPEGPRYAEPFFIAEEYVSESSEADQEDYGYESDPTPEFVAFEKFDKVLTALCPQIGVLQYKKVANECIKQTFYYDSDPYTRATHQVKYADVRHIARTLEKMGIELQTGTDIGI